MIGSLVKMEGQNFSRDALVLESAEAATFVTLPASGRYFTAFLARDRAPAEVARELGVDIGSVTYRVKQMLRLGLIRPTQKVARRGRAIQYYRSVADSVFAPMELTPVSTVRELFHASRSDSRRTLDQSVERAWLAIGSHQGWGSHLYRPDADREVNRDFIPRHLLNGGMFWETVVSDAAPPVWDQHAWLRLTRDQAKELQRELATIVSRYANQEQSVGSTSEYLLHLALAQRAP